MSGKASRIFTAVTWSLLAAAPLPCLAQPSSADPLVVDAQRRIQSLTERFRQVQDSTQAKLDAANCRVGCSPDVSRRLDDEMIAAFDQITAEIHAAVDSFVRRTVAAGGGGFDLDRTRDGLRMILPPSDEPRSA